MPRGVAVAAKTAVVLTGWLVVIDIVGVIVCTLFDIAPLRANSGLLPYAIWFVLGLFCGMFAYQSAGAWAFADREGEWSDQPGAFRAGNVIVATGAVLVGLLLLFFRHIYWSRGVAGEYYVPESAPHSILFGLCVLAAMAGTHFLLLPTPGQES